MASSGSALVGRTVLVTGGSGFIGRHLVRRLAAVGARPVILDALTYGQQPVERAADLSVRHERLLLGNADHDALVQAVRGADFVVHLAARKHNQAAPDGRQILRENVLGSFALFEACKNARVERVVFASSVYAYGRSSPTPLSENEPATPATVYGISKLAGEQLLAAAARDGGFEYNVLRYFFVYGPEQLAERGRESVMVKNFRRLLRGEPPTVHGDGKQLLDYVFVDDAVEATMLALSAPANGETINVGSGGAVSVEEVVRTMLRVAGHATPIEYGPADDTARTCRVANIEKAARLLGYAPRTRLEDGLQKTLDWVRSEKGA